MSLKSVVKKVKTMSKKQRSNFTFFALKISRIDFTLLIAFLFSLNHWYTLFIPLIKPFAIEECRKVQKLAKDLGELSPKWS